jgi:hypothetical protein
MSTFVASPQNRKNRHSRHPEIKGLEPAHWFL